MSRKNDSRITAAALTALGLFVAGCGTEGGSANVPVATLTGVVPAAGPQSISAVNTASGARQPAQTSSAGPTAQAVDNGPVIPNDAKYSITCQTWRDANHIQIAKSWRDALVKATGRREFYILNSDNGSTLYFGYYRQIDHTMDPAEAKRADADLAFVRGLGDDQNHIFFPGALKEALPVPDPEGPPQFDLARIDSDKAPDDPARKYWSIAVAAYTADANFGGADAGKSRKQLAVETVQEMRKHGIEAYYYNGENVSTVCVGAWPRDAVKEQEAGEAKSQADNGEEIVVSSKPLSKEVKDEIAQSGKDIKVFEPKVEVDEKSTLLSTWQQYKEYAVNGYVKMTRRTDPKTGQSVEHPQSSFLVEIPRLQPSLLPSAQGDTPQTETTSTDTTQNPLQPSSGAGRLRSVTP